MTGRRKTVLLVGHGRMGQALARGWAGTWRVMAHDPRATFPAEVEPVESLADLPDDACDAVVLAVKPAVLETLLPQLRRFAGAGATIVSVAAGWRIAALAAILGSDASIVRAMPNTPAGVGKGITALVAPETAGEQVRAIAQELMAAVGQTLWLDDEAQIDAVTAVSGSGPAYMFRFTEALARAGAAQGLDSETAMLLARATLIGAAALVETQPETLAILRAQVTSPGGTTAAALARFDGDDALDSIVRDAVAAAAERSRALGG